MPRVNNNGTGQNVEGLDEKIKDVLPSLIISTNPVVICGVNRRIGLGNFEHIDIYAGVALPIADATAENLQELREAIAVAAEFGFNTVSTETYERYKLLVDVQKNS